MGNTIVAARLLAEKTMLFEIEAEHIARRGRAGQFVILRVSEDGERIPLTIAHRDEAKGTITIVAQEVGKTTRDLNALGVGAEILDLAGPLGKPTDIPGGGKTVLCVGGGIGNAVVWPLATAMKAAGNTCILKLYEGADHGFFNSGRHDNRWYEATLTDVVSFLQNLGWIEQS